MLNKGSVSESEVKQCSASDSGYNKYNKKLKEYGLSDEYKLIDVYTQNAHTYLKLLHLKCNGIYEVDQYKFFKKNCRCQNPDCKSSRVREKKLIKPKVIIKRIKEQGNNEYEILSEYKGVHENIKLKHLKCGSEFLMHPNNFFKGQRCPVCAQLIRNQKNTKSEKEFEKEIFQKFSDEYEILTPYNGAKNDVKFLHKKCKRIITMTADKALSGNSICQFCNKPTKGEKRIIDYLDNKIGVNNYVYQKYYNDLLGVNGGRLSYDFFIPEYNLLIEYQGEYHDGSVSCQTQEDIDVQKEHDIRKKEYAKQHEIQLLEIWYWDFDKIEDILDLTLKIE